MTGDAADVPARRQLGDGRIGGSVGIPQLWPLDIEQADTRSAQALRASPAVRRSFDSTAPRACHG